ncbi:MAG: FAD-binding oxidoreductase [Pseudonocardiaceae bacterium]|nr:FAD-binding oxidoreductase [Pseudonocardiaceae bacterium]
MRKILIVGAGQSGLQLALSLRDHDYDVTVISARTPEEIRGGRVMSTQCMFHTALQYERDHGLNLWEEECVKIEGQGFSLAGPDGNRALNWFAPWNSYAQSVDQRVKMAGWLELLEERGGKVVIHGVTTADLNSLATLYDLVIVAAGKGELVQLFDRDPSRSPYNRPQRALAVSYVHGMELRPEHPDAPNVWMNIVPGVCEVLSIPGYTLSGNCDILYLSGVPGGPFDCWSDRPGPREHIRRTLELLREYVPWEYERSRNAELTDDRGTLVGGFAPVVRNPVGELPAGQPVLGIADVVVANDPVTGQGSNNASKCAESYLDSIVKRGDQPFDRNWMRAAFENYWEHAQHVTKWTNGMLQPPPPHVQEFLGAAQTHPAAAKRFAEGVNDPTDFQHFWYDPDKMADYLASLSATA